MFKGALAWIGRAGCHAILFNTTHAVAKVLPSLSLLEFLEVLVLTQFELIFAWVVWVDGSSES